MRERLPVLREQAVAAQLRRDGHAAPAAQLAPHAARDRQPRVAGDADELDAVRARRLFWRRAGVHLPVPTEHTSLDTRQASLTSQLIYLPSPQQAWAWALGSLHDSARIAIVAGPAAARTLQKEWKGLAFETRRREALHSRPANCAISFFRPAWYQGQLWPGHAVDITRKETRGRAEKAAAMRTSRLHSTM